MENSHKFFVNLKCKYFPCHPKPEQDNFNCLFCFCPLYSLGNDCGGIFTYDNEKKQKSCMDCHLPHKPEFYDVIINKLRQVKIS